MKRKRVVQSKLFPLKKKSNVKVDETFLSIVKDESKVALVRYFDAFLTRKQANELYAEIYAKKDTLFKQDTYILFGNAKKAPRLSAAFGSKGSTYTYSGMTQPAITDWPLKLLECKALVEQKLDCKLNYALVNIYETGKDYIGWHSDDEKDLESNTPICSISLGDERKFQLREKYSKGETPTKIYSKVLAHGSLCTMEKQTQQICKHKVPVKPKASSPRINITFRSIIN